MRPIDLADLCHDRSRIVQAAAVKGSSRSRRPPFDATLTRPLLETRPPFRQHGWHPRWLFRRFPGDRGRPELLDPLQKRLSCKVVRIDFQRSQNRFAGGLEVAAIEG
jgi:hypothetical protein